MTDPRITALAQQLVGHSISLKKGDHVLIDVSDVPPEVPIELIKAVRDAGGFPHINIQNGQVNRELAQAGESERLEASMGWEMHRMKSMSAYIAVRGHHNVNELADVKADTMGRITGHMRPLLDYRVNETNWVVLRWPTPSMAQQAGMSTAEFEDFYFRVCLLDYAALKPHMNALKKRMEATDKVHITGPGTDLTFSIKDIPAVICGGNHNIPDGEVFTAPVKTSVNGVVSYNAPTIYQSCAFDHVKLTFKDGKIIEGTANNTKRLNEILDSDEGARFIGEFAIGFNRYILHPMRDILFDEKIGGSFHFTPGQAYDEAWNGNTSAVHWDLVSIQREDYGGGEIYFDGELIRKNGIFVVDDLKGLN